jgi:prophage maintenance system killer protein
MDSRGKVIVYKGNNGKVTIDVNLKEETVWLSLNQMTRLFNRDKSVISRHLRNVFKARELYKSSVVAKFATTALDGKVYNVEYYNLDAIISVGYRVNSKRGTQFRIWATDILKKHLINGYTLNERRLKEQAHKLQALQNAIELISHIKDGKELDHKEAVGLLSIISDYSYALGLLDDYDNKRIRISDTSKIDKFKLTYENAACAIEQLKDRFGYSELFGRQKDESFKSSIAVIYQTFDGRDLYPSVEEKAANLLYFIIKNHSFIDGNKRIAASIFLWFLDNNGLLYKKDGSKRLADNALVALTLMIAESKPQEHNMIMSLVVSLINKRN